MAVPSLQDQITQYVSRLSIKQKRAVLAMVKGFVEEEEGGGYSEAFIRELDRRSAEIRAGKDVLVTEEEMKTRVDRLLRQKGCLTSS